MATGFRYPYRNDAPATAVQIVIPAGKQVSRAKDGNAQDIKQTLCAILSIKVISGESL